MAIQPDGTRVLFTNIDPDVGKREEFWRLVEEHEYDASPDKMTFTIANNPKFWKAAALHPDCPKELSSAIEDAVVDKPITINVADNVEMRRFLSTQDGWVHAGEKRPGESNDEYKIRHADNTAKFQDGRGGRVQYRIIGELPHELTVAERASILKTFSDEFAKRNLPFVSVMHAPDHTNSDKNWHFHLVYYDRPASRVTREQVDENAKKRNEGAIKPFKPDYDQVGKWDFSVAETYIRPGRYEKRTSYPYAQEKVKEVSQDKKGVEGFNGKRWVEGLRDRLAEITNNHLERAGIERRLDPRRHEEMGIHSDPQEHLGTRLANMEAMGIATPTGVSNEERQWKAIMTRMDGDLTRRKTGVDRQGERWLKEIDRATMSVDTKKQVRGYVTRWHQHRTESEEHQSIAENLDQHMERMLSRANKVRETCEKNLAAINDGKATKFQSSRKAQLIAKNADAIEWLQRAAEVLKDEQKLIEESRENARRERQIADTIEKTIENALRVGRGSLERGPAPKDIAANDDRAKEAAAAAVEAADVQRRRAVNKQIVEAWVEDIRRRRRRVVRDGRTYRPANVVEGDLQIIEAPNYGTMASGRLKAVMEEQDKAIAEVIAQIETRPRLVVSETINGRTRYLLTTSRQDLADTFAAFSEDPSIVKARQDALAGRQEAATPDVRRAAERVEAPRQTETARDRNQPEPRMPRDREASPAEPVRTERPVAPVGSAERDRIDADRRADDRARDQARRAEEAGNERGEISRRIAINERIARAVMAEGRRVLIREGVATLSPRNMEAIAATPEDIADRALQKRLVGIASVQARELARITGQARKNPATIVDIDGVTTISQRGSREVVELARKWRDDEAIQMTLAGIRIEHENGRAAVNAPPRAEQVPLPLEPIPRDRSPEPERTAAPVPSRERAAAPAPVVVPRMTELRPDYDMRAEAKAYAEEQERKLARDAAQEKSRTRTGRSRNAPEGADQIDRVAQTAAQRAATQGAHPLIDEWIKAVDDGLGAGDRRAIALRISNERAAREKLRDIDRGMARRIREDAELARSEQQPGLGLGIEQGATPKR